MKKFNHRLKSASLALGISDKRGEELFVMCMKAREEGDSTSQTCEKVLNLKATPIEKIWCAMNMGHNQAVASITENARHTIQSLMFKAAHKMDKCSTKKSAKKPVRKAGK